MSTLTKELGINHTRGLRNMTYEIPLGKKLKMIEQEEERLLAEEELLRQQEWMNAMDVAYEQGIYK